MAKVSKHGYFEIDPKQLTIIDKRGVFGGKFNRIIPSPWSSIKPKFARYTIMPNEAISHYVDFKFYRKHTDQYLPPYKHSDLEGYLQRLDMEFDKLYAVKDAFTRLPVHSSTALEFRHRLSLFLTEELLSFASHASLTLDDHEYSLYVRFKRRDEVLRVTFKLKP